MRTRELLTVIEIGGIVAVGLGALTDLQKQWVRRRDKDKCVAPVKHKCGGGNQKHNKPIHHILGQRYCSEVGIDPDFPENLVEICQNFHDEIHPDVPQARRQYHTDQQSFPKMFAEREKKLKAKIVPWNDEHDRKLQVVAIRNTQKYTEEHPEDPFPKKKKKITLP